MASKGWTECLVDEIKAATPHALATGPFGSAISSRHFVGHGVPVIRGSNLSQNVGVRLIDADLVFLSDEKAKEFTRSIARRGDLVFTCWGTIDQVGLIDNRSQYQEYVVSNKQMKLTPDSRKADSLFLYYLFSSPIMRDRFRNQGIGSSVPGFNLGQLKSMTLNLPPLTEQCAIAHVLGTLDDRIELNRQMNATLEAMARALFKSWFVDFDPVRAKAAGRDPGLPKHLADLFPDSFEDTELGEIPRGWEVARIGDLAIRVMEKVEDSADWAELSLIDLSRMPQGSVALSDWGKGAELSTSVTRFEERDTLFGAIRPYFHKVGVAPMSGVTNVSVFVIRSRQELDWPFLGILCSMDDTVAFATRVARGTKMPVVSWHDFQGYSVTLPPRSLREVFGQIAAPLFDRINRGIHESMSLTELRDTLLPKLISGELRVPDAERFVGKVA